MKYIILVLALCACGPKDFTDKTFEYSIIKIEGCEYIKPVGLQPYQSYVHKGNCSNPIHKCN